MREKRAPVEYVIKSFSSFKRQADRMTEKVGGRQFRSLFAVGGTKRRTWRSTSAHWTSRLDRPYPRRVDRKDDFAIGNGSALTRRGRAITARSLDVAVEERLMVSLEQPLRLRTPQPRCRRMVIDGLQLDAHAETTLQLALALLGPDAGPQGEPSQRQGPRGRDHRSAA